MYQHSNGWFSIIYFTYKIYIYIYIYVNVYTYLFIPVFTILIYTYTYVRASLFAFILFIIMLCTLLNSYSTYCAYTVCIYIYIIYGISSCVYILDNFTNVGGQLQRKPLAIRSSHRMAQSAPCDLFWEHRNGVRRSPMSSVTVQQKKGGKDDSLAVQINDVYVSLTEGERPLNQIENGCGTLKLSTGWMVLRISIWWKLHQTRLPRLTKGLPG